MNHSYPWESALNPKSETLRFPEASNSKFSSSRKFANNNETKVRYSFFFNLLEQRMKVWKKERKKKASSPTSLRINTWIVFHSLYIESSFLHFSLPQLRSISSTFLSSSHISVDAFPANFSLFLSVTLKFRLDLRVTF